MCILSDNNLKNIINKLKNIQKSTPKNNVFNNKKINIKKFIQYLKNVNSLPNLLYLTTINKNETTILKFNIQLTTLNILGK